jgi:hypothetical protein
VTERTTELEESYGQIAGRDAYREDLGSPESVCRLRVDNGDYSLLITLDRTGSQASEKVTVCEAAEQLVP